MIRLSSILGTLIVLMCMVAVGEADGPARPGLALKFDVVGNNASLVVAFDYLQQPQDLPRFVGVRRYTYDIALGDAPVRVGWKGETETVVLIDGVKYIYTPGLADRHENGSISIASQDESEGTFRIKGAYHYADQLFVIDAIVKAGAPVLLYETALEK